MPSFDYDIVWRTLDDATRDRIVAFWQTHGAIRDEQAARARVDQVVAVARSEGGEIAGVCTAIDLVVPDIGEPLYYYRTFIAPPFRTGFVVRRLLFLAVQALEEHARRDPESSAKGVYLELENPSFARHLRQAVWPRRGLEFVFIGRSARGLERRVRWFEHARIGDRSGDRSTG
ncbi:hypothetical protein [Halomonas denitrificans]|nr:hypothetical protein [Halomonas denitrificans]